MSKSYVWNNQLSKRIDHEKQITITEVSLQFSIHFQIMIKAWVWSLEKKVDLARIFEWAQLSPSSSAAAALPSKPLHRGASPAWAGNRCIKKKWQQNSKPWLFYFWSIQLNYNDKCLMPSHCTNPSHKQNSLHRNRQSYQVIIRSSSSRSFLKDE